MLSALLKITPKVGALVETPDGQGHVEEANLLTGVLKVKLKNNPDAPPASYKREDVKLLRDSRIKVNRDELAALKDLED